VVVVGCQQPSQPLRLAKIGTCVFLLAQPPARVHLVGGGGGRQSEGGVMGRRSLKPLLRNYRGIIS